MLNLSAGVGALLSVKSNRQAFLKLLIEENEYEDGSNKAHDILRSLSPPAFDLVIRDSELGPATHRFLFAGGSRDSEQQAEAKARTLICLTESLDTLAAMEEQWKLSVALRDRGPHGGGEFEKLIARLECLLANPLPPCPKPIEEDQLVQQSLHTSSRDELISKFETSLRGKDNDEPGPLMLASLYNFIHEGLRLCQMETMVTAPGTFSTAIERSNEFCATAQTLLHNVTRTNISYNKEGWLPSLLGAILKERGSSSCPPD